MTYIAKVYPDQALSPEYLYHCTVRRQCRDNCNPLPNAAVSFQNAFEVLRERGICDRKLMNDWLVPPSAEADQDARKHRSLFREDTILPSDQHTIKAYLQDKQQPLPVGMFVDKAFKKNEFPIKHGKPVWSGYRDELRNAHAMLLVGWDDELSAYEVMNSYGPNWGDAGFVWIDYAFFQEATKYVFDPLHEPLKEAPTTLLEKETPPASAEIAATGLLRTSAGTLAPTSPTPLPNSSPGIFVSVSAPATLSPSPSPFEPASVAVATPEMTPVVKIAEPAETLYCRLGVLDSSEKLDPAELAFDVDIDAIQKGEIQPGSILTRSERVRVLRVRRQVATGQMPAGQVLGSLLPGDKFQVSELKKYKMPDGETQYWVGGTVVVEISSGDITKE
ncbi:MAG TPA: C1 family peptidase [Chthoniobacterales bacterium]|nr:C1 family peptidase [Chthoniobacterales bacterium]